VAYRHFHLQKPVDCKYRLDCQNKVAPLHLPGEKTIPVSDQIQEIVIGDFDLSLGEMRIMNKSRVVQVEKSLRLHGQLQPVVARAHAGGIQLIDGFKRVYAAEALLMETLQCRLLEIDEDQAKVLLLSYNWSTQSLVPYEEALVLQDLLKSHGLDQRRLSQLTGKSPSWVSRRLSLIGRLDEGISTEIRMGVLSSSHARALMRLPRGNQVAVAGVIRTNQLTSRQADCLVDVFLAAENEQTQDLILRHPEMFCAKQEVWGSLKVYDERLTSYGNELFEGIHCAIESIQHFLTLLGERGFDALGELEQMILFPGFAVIRECAARLTVAITQIQIHHTQQHDER
jgi:ParB/RepB/Spo0J family partition protein